MIAHSETGAGATETGDDTSSTEPPATDHASRVSPEAAASASAAYRATQEAFNRGDAEAYAAGYAPVMTCFHGRTEQRFRRRPQSGALVHVHHLEVLSATDEEAWLADFGAYAPSHLRVTPHRKLVRMRRVGDRWVIVGETSLDEPGCMSAPRDAHPPPTFGACLAPQRDCLREVDRDYPVEAGGSNGWDWRTTECTCAAWRCLGGRVDELGCDDVLDEDAP